MTNKQANTKTYTPAIIIAIFLTACTTNNPSTSPQEMASPDASLDIPAQADTAPADLPTQQDTPTPEDITDQPDLVQDLAPDTSPDMPAPDLPAPDAPKPNLVLIVLDDVGIEAIEPWKSTLGTNAQGVFTPTLDMLAANGATLYTAWATPTCSPTRMGLHTGLYPSHGGILGPIRGITPLTNTTQTLPRILGDQYRSGLFGKWHLGGNEAAPVTLGGWDHYSGQPSGALADYFDWQRTVVTEDGTVDTKPEDLYATTAAVDDALSWLQTQPTQTPWLVMLALNAPHTPFHMPPPTLRPSYSDAILDANNDGACDEDFPCYQAAIQAADTEIGRFLDQASALDNGRDTIVIVIGDNGTPGPVIQRPYTRPHAKGTLYEGGVRVPVWIHGPADLLPVRGSLPGLAHASVDVFATLLDLAGQPIPEGVDGRSLLPMLQIPGTSIRDTLYTDGNSGPTNAPIEGAVLRTDTFKVHWYDVTVPNAYGCFDLLEDPNEQNDLTQTDAPPICAELFAALQATR